ncbi:MAG: hypothetical protein AB7L66_09220 [Gemmatimonadales bacterium]
MSDWLPTQRQKVAVHLTDRRVLRGDVHLQVAQHHSGQETTTDLFNRGEPFFALVLEDAAPVFIAKGQVLYAEIGPTDADEDADRISAARRVELEVEMADGSLLEGVVMFELPPDRLRALDFLNAAPAFFPLWHEEAVRIVNRNHIRAASPLVDIKRGTS